MILDTTFVIDIMDDDEDAIKKSEDLIAQGETQLITVLTVFELFRGIIRSDKPPEEKKKVINKLRGQLILNLDKDSAEKAGELDGKLAKEGNLINPVDSMIAGIAFVNKEKILTRNVRHFSKIEGLEVETY